MSAIKGAGAILNIASAVNGSAIAISAATAALPCVLTTAANTFTAGEIGVITGVVGMTQLNNRAYVMSPVGSTSATLKGEDATLYSAYVSGGTVQGYSMELIANITDVKGFQGQPAEIDITNLQSQAKEYVLGLQDFGTVDITAFLASGSTDAGQAMLRSIKQQQVAWPFSLQLADGTITAFMAFVKQFGFEGVKPEGAVGAPIVLRVTNKPAWFA